MLQISMMPGCLCSQTWREGQARLSISVQGRHKGAKSPACQQRSTILHDYFYRRPFDLPMIGWHVRLDLRIRRYACRNADCQRQTFGEKLPTLIAPAAQRTNRLAKAQAGIGTALGGAAGSRHATQIAMPASGDTILRLVRRMPQPLLPAPTVIGADDWAMKKRLRYGTIVVDLERHCTIDLLLDRAAGTVTNWLRRMPEIGIVARDHSTEYRRGITTGAPNTIQVADRWHLLHNARQKLKRWTAGAHARLRRLLPLQSVETSGKSRAKAFPRTSSDATNAADSRGRRTAQY